MKPYASGFGARSPTAPGSLLKEHFGWAKHRFSGGTRHCPLRTRSRTRISTGADAVLVTTALTLRGRLFSSTDRLSQTGCYLMIVAAILSAIATVLIVVMLCFAVYDPTRTAGM